MKSRYAPQLTEGKSYTRGLNRLSLNIISKGGKTMNTCRGCKYYDEHKFGQREGLPFCSNPKGQKTISSDIYFWNTQMESPFWCPLKLKK